MSARDLHFDGNSDRQRANRALNEAIARVANRQGGVISRKQLMALGLDGAGIDNRVRVGLLRVIHRGVYAVGHDAIPIRGRLCGALLVAGAGSALRLSDLLCVGRGCWC